jgi:hypothetical protein
VGVCRVEVEAWVGVSLIDVDGRGRRSSFPAAGVWWSVHQYGGPGEFPPWPAALRRTIVFAAARTTS